MFAVYRVEPAARGTPRSHADERQRRSDKFVALRKQIAVGNCEGTRLCKLITPATLSAADASGVVAIFLSPYTVQSIKTCLASIKSTTRLWHTVVDVDNICLVLGQDIISTEVLGCEQFCREYLVTILRHDRGVGLCCV